MDGGEKVTAVMPGRVIGVALIYFVLWGMRVSLCSESLRCCCLAPEYNQVPAHWWHSEGQQSDDSPSNELHASEFM